MMKQITIGLFIAMLSGCMTQPELPTEVVASSQKSCEYISLSEIEKYRAMSNIQDPTAQVGAFAVDAMRDNNPYAECQDAIKAYYTALSQYFESTGQTWQQGIKALGIGGAIYLTGNALEGLVSAGGISKTTTNTTGQGNSVAVDRSRSETVRFDYIRQGNDGAEEVTIP